MGRTDTVRRPLTAAARSHSNPYASSYDQVASPLSLNFPPYSAGFPSGVGAGHNSSDSPPSYDHFTIPTHIKDESNSNCVPQLARGSYPSINTAPAAAREDLPEGTYALEPDEFGSYPGFPSVAEYEDIQEAYLRNLSSRKQEKALITQAMYDSIHAVLMDPTNTSYGTPQFRFWVRKMFVLAAFQGEYTVTHEDKPVAAKEQIYQILVHCHGECYHGGRDKTCTQIKQYYSWIPKELVAQFVKACPTCVLKRSNNPKKFVAMLKDIGGGSGGPDDEYVDYFTSPTRYQSQIPVQRGNRGGMPPRYIKPEPPVAPRSLDDTFGGFAVNHHQPQHQHQLHYHHQQHVYTPGLLDDDNKNNVNHLGSRPLSSSSSSHSLNFSRRPSGSSIGAGGVASRQVSGGVSSHVHTPLSGVFPGNIYAEFDQSQSGGDSGWPTHQQQHFGGVGMGRQAGRSLDNGRYPTSLHPSQQYLSASAAIGHSTSDGALPYHQYNDIDEDDAGPALSIPSRTYYDLPTFNVSSGDHHHHQQQQQQLQHHQSNSVIDVDTDGSLINMQYHHHGQVLVKVEESVTTTSVDVNNVNNLLQPTPSLLVNRRRRGLAPATLNLDLSGSNFAEYRGGAGLMSATTPTSAVASDYGAAMASPIGDWTSGGHSGVLHHPRPAVPIRSASLLSVGGGGSDVAVGGSGPGSAVAAQFPELNLGSTDDAEGEDEEQVMVGSGGADDAFSALDVLASSAIGSFNHQQAQQQLSSFSKFDHQQQQHIDDNGFQNLDFHQQLQQQQYQNPDDEQLYHGQLASIAASVGYGDYADDVVEEEDHGALDAQVEVVGGVGGVEVVKVESDDANVVVGEQEI